MNLQLPDPPEGSVNELQSAIRNLSAHRQFSTQALRRAQPEQLSATAPLAVYTLTANDLKEHRSIRTAEPTGWRYLLEVNERVVASAETVHTSKGKHAFANITDGPFVKGTTAALAAAEEIARDHDAEVSIVHVPSLYFMGLCLRRAGEADYSTIIPIAPAPPGLEANRAYPEDELMAELAERASSIPEMGPDDTRGG